jgi:hypothetical protein
MCCCVCTAYALGTGYCYGVVPYKASHARLPLSDLICSAPHLSFNHFRLIHHSCALIPADTPSSEEGRKWARNSHCILPISIYHTSRVL